MQGGSRDEPTVDIGREGSGTQGRLPGGGVGRKAEKLSPCVADGFPMEPTPTSLARQGPATAMDTRTTAMSRGPRCRPALRDGERDQV